MRLTTKRLCRGLNQFKTHKNTLPIKRSFFRTTKLSNSLFGMAQKVIELLQSLTATTK